MNQVPRREAGRAIVFVDRIARLFIGLSVLATAIALAQNALLFTTFARPEIGSIVEATDDPRLLFIGFLLLSLLTLATSIALLKRRRWARPAFIAIMALALASCVAKLLLGRPSSSASLPTEGPPPFLLVLRMARILDFAAPALGSFFFAWIIFRLASPAIRREFQRERE